MALHVPHNVLVVVRDYDTADINSLTRRWTTLLQIYLNLIRITNRIESIRITNWNALVTIEKCWAWAVRVSRVSGDMASVSVRVRCQRFRCHAQRPSSVLR